MRRRQWRGRFLGSAGACRQARRGAGRRTRECRDNGAVNSELLPEYPVGYSCYNEAGEFYNAMVSPDGVLLSLSGPFV
jgi:hypothetical protein